MEFEQAVQRITRLASEHDGVVTAALIESDEELSRDHETVSAAGHMLAGSTNVFSAVGNGEREWFPYAELRFTEL